MYDRPSLHPLFREICYLLEHVEMHELNWTELHVDYNCFGGNFGGHRLPVNSKSQHPRTYCWDVYSG